MNINIVQSCNTASLEAFVPTSTNSWNEEKVRHLHNRIGFGIEPNLIKGALELSPSDYLDTILDTTIALPPISEPAWASLDKADYEANGFGDAKNFELVNDTQYVFTKELISNPIRGRFMLFWHNHLVTNTNDYNFAGYAFRYMQIIEKHAFGNFKDLVYYVGKSEAMLLYLNGFSNVAGNPNENYARELYELFTLGEGKGYTEKDIVETSRALTGYNKYSNGWYSRIEFNPDKFDNTNKTIFGQTGNWNYDDVVDILFEQKSEQIGKHICEKIYKHFVSPEVDDEIRSLIINPLGKLFVESNFEITPVLKKLFKSEHFFSENAKKTIIKSPLDTTISLLKNTGLLFKDLDDEDTRSALIYTATSVGQSILSPPTVAGWIGDKEWINSGVFIQRVQNVKNILYRLFKEDEESFRAFAKTISDDSTDPVYVTEQIFKAVLNEKPYSKDDFEDGVDAFKARVPSNYFETNTWTLDFPDAHRQVLDLLFYIAAIPDYQLK